MNSKKLNTNDLMKSIFGMFFILCILISSCAVKYGIKNLLNIDNGAKNLSLDSKVKFASSSTSSVSQCKFCKVNEVTSKSDISFSISDLQELAIFTLILFAGAFLFVNIQKHPLYNSSKIGNTIPIFIQYRKLII